jgi:hypothetical protein
MPIVKITPAGESITCKAGEGGRFQFNISNAAGRKIRFGAQVKGNNGPINWLTVDGAAERGLDASASSTVELVARPPADLLKIKDGNKHFNFKLRVHDAEDPEEIVDSVTVRVEVIPAPPQPKKFPWWIVILLLAVTGLGVGLYYAFK